MKTEQLRSILYKAGDGSEVEILNDNAPVKASLPISQVFTMETEDGKQKVVLLYQSKNGKEGSRA